MGILPVFDLPDAAEQRTERGVQGFGSDFVQEEVTWGDERRGSSKGKRRMIFVRALGSSWVVTRDFRSHSTVCKR